MLAAIVDCDGQPDEIGKDGGPGDQVLIGRLSLDARAVSTFCTSGDRQTGLF